MALLHHDARHMADAVEASLQVDLDDTVEIFFLHPQQQTVFGDAGIVDQHIDAAKIVQDSFYRVPALLLVKKIIKDAKIYRVEDKATLESTLEALRTPSEEE